MNLRWAIITEMSYKANKFGEVTGTYAKLGFLKKDNTSNGFNINGTWPWITWRYLNDKTKIGLKNAEKITDEQKKAKSLADAMNISGNDSWIYRLHQWYVYLIHPRYAKLLKKYDLYKKPTWGID